MGTLSSAEAPSVGKRREKGENIKREKTGKLKISGARGTSHALLFPFSPAPARFISPLPIPQPNGKTKETSAEERVTGDMIEANLRVPLREVGTWKSHEWFADKIEDIISRKAVQECFLCVFTVTSRVFVFYFQNCSKLRASDCSKNEQHLIQCSWRTGSNNHFSILTAYQCIEGSERSSYINRFLATDDIIFRVSPLS